MMSCANASVHVPDRNDWVRASLIDERGKYPRAIAELKFGRARIRLQYPFIVPESTGFVQKVGQTGRFAGPPLDTLPSLANQPRCDILRYSGRQIVARSKLPPDRIDNRPVKPLGSVLRCRNTPSRYPTAPVFWPVLNHTNTVFPQE